MVAPISGPVMEVQVEWGTVRATMAGLVVVGDRVVPPLIEVDFPGVDGQPSLFMRIEVIEGVPRCTELTLRRADNGREIRPRDLSAVQLDSFIEMFVAVCSGRVTASSSQGWAGEFGDGEAFVRGGMKTIRDVRKGSRRPLRGERRQRVADVYNAHESGGIEAVEAAFVVSRSTAIRYIRAARDAGLIHPRG